MKHKIEIDYDGAYPCLCSGHLVVTIDGTPYDFGYFSLESGGYIADDWESVYTDEWIIKKYPTNFPNDEKLKKAVLKAINKKIEHGCCGGCI